MLQIILQLRMDKELDKLGGTNVEKPLTRTKIAVVGDDEAVGQVAAVYNEWRTKTGRQIVPGILKCFSARPDFLRQVIDFSNTVHFSDGHLLRRHKEMIATYVSALNHCPY
jgi:hypothetical protein